MISIHDAGYKRLFSNKRIFRQFLESFVQEDWVSELDFSTCQIIDKSFIADHYKKTECDLIYRVKIGGKDIYIIILIEFQSTVDRFMSLRILNYITNFYMDYIRNNKKAKKLPALFPILLYNGSRRWTAPTELAELIEGQDLLGKYGIHFAYFKIAENEYSKEKLLKMSNLVSTLFLAETYYDIELIKDEFLKLFDREEDKAAISLLLNWFLQLQQHERIAPEDYKTLERVYHDKSEVNEMLISAIKKEKKQIFEKGVKEGLQKGLREGMQKGIEKGRYEQRIEVAKVLLRLGHDVETIRQAAQLSLKEIEDLRKSLRL